MTTLAPTEPLPRFAVFGAGAVGSYYGAMLARAGVPVVLIGRPAHVQAMRAHGLRLQTADFDERIAVHADTDAAAVAGADVVLVCDPADTATYYTERPCLIVEVLSESTERIDRREKLLAYQKLPSLQAYLLVAQDARRVEIFRRSTDWRHELHTEGAIELPCVDSPIALDDIYIDVGL